MSKKILIVEDEKGLLELLSDIFTSETDYEVVLAGDGEEAISTAREENPDLVVLDIQIPKIDGFEVCNIIKCDDSLSHIKVLMLTGLAQNYHKRLSREVGADAYITKPFRPLTLLLTVDGLLKAP